MPFFHAFLTLHVVLTRPVVVQGVPSDTPLVVDADAVVAVIMGETLHVAVNQTAVVDCTVSNNTGLPVGSVVFAWTFFGIPITDSGRMEGKYSIDENETTSRLTIHDVGRVDAGIYRCVVENPAGYQRAAVEVKGERSGTLYVCACVPCVSLCTNMDCVLRVYLCVCVQACVCAIYTLCVHMYMCVHAHIYVCRQSNTCASTESPSNCTEMIDLCTQDIRACLWSSAIHLSPCT